MSNDEADEEEEPPNKTQRARHVYNQQAGLSLKQRSLTPENLTDDPLSFHRTKSQMAAEKRLNHGALDGSQGSLLDKNSSRNNTIDRQHLRVPDKPFISSRSSSSSSSEAENELVPFRRTKHRSSGKTPGENRIRRSR